MADLAEVLAALDKYPDLVNRMDAMFTELSDLRRASTGILAEVGLFMDGELREAHPPLCQECGAALQVRVNRSSGGRFLGCVEWSDTGCKGVRQYLEWRDEAMELLSQQAPEDYVMVFLAETDGDPVVKVLTADQVRETVNEYGLTPHDYLLLDGKVVKGFANKTFDLAKLP